MRGARVSAIGLVLLACCSTTHEREDDERLDASVVTDTLVTSDALRPSDAATRVDAPADARATCPTWPRAAVSPPSGDRTCLDQRVRTTTGVSCTSGGTFIEVTSGTDAPMRSVTVTREHVETNTRLCVSAYDDCTCRDTQCLEPGESFELLGAHAYRRLVIENDGEPVRVIVCN